jgi:hypothetical protein
MGTYDLTRLYPSVTEISWDNVDWVHLAPDRDRWWALMDTVMNLRVP